ncbi:MAG: hypothetical protein ACXVDD_20470 [Polyangia bacterium]
MAIALLVPLVAAADVSVGERGADHCLDAVRRALAGDYPNDDGDEHFCRRDRGGLDCFDLCVDRSCHNDACESWSSSLEVELEPASGAPTSWSRRPDGIGGWIYQRRARGSDVRVRIYARRDQEFARQFAEHIRQEAVRARRVLDACLAQ